MAPEVARKGGAVFQNLVAYVALVVLQLIVAVELDTVALDVTYELESSRALGTQVRATDIMEPLVGHQFGLGIETAMTMRTAILAQVHGHVLVERFHTLERALAGLTWETFGRMTDSQMSIVCLLP